MAELPFPMNEEEKNRYSMLQSGDVAGFDASLRRGQPQNNAPFSQSIPQTQQPAPPSQSPPQSAPARTNSIPNTPLVDRTGTDRSLENVGNYYGGIRGGARAVGSLLGAMGGRVADTARQMGAGVEAVWTGQYPWERMQEVNARQQRGVFGNLENSLLRNAIRPAVKDAVAGAYGQPGQPGQPGQAVRPGQPGQMGQTGDMTGGVSHRKSAQYMQNNYGGTQVAGQEMLGPGNRTAGGNFIYGQSPQDKNYEMSNRFATGDYMSFSNRGETVPSGAGRRQYSDQELYPEKYRQESIPMRGNSSDPLYNNLINNTRGQSVPSSSGTGYGMSAEQRRMQQYEQENIDRRRRWAESGIAGGGGIFQNVSRGRVAEIQGELMKSREAQAAETQRAQMREMGDADRARLQAGTTMRGQDIQRETSMADIDQKSKQFAEQNNLNWFNATNEQKKMMADAQIRREGNVLQYAGQMGAAEIGARSRENAAENKETPKERMTRELMGRAMGNSVLGEAPEEWFNRLPKEVQDEYKRMFSTENSSQYEYRTNPETGVKQRRKIQ